MNRRLSALLFFFGLVLLPCFSQEKSAFESGLFYFRANQPTDAIEMFTKAIEGNDCDPQAYVFLSVSYFQLFDFQNSLDICKKGLSVSGSDKKILNYNAGNASFALNDFEGAEEYFRRSLQIDPDFKSGILNLGNVLVEERKYAEAIGVYEHFLTIAKDDPQGDQVEEIIEKLRAQIEENKDLGPVLISIDDVEYLNRKDALEEEFRKRKIPEESLGEEYFLRSGKDGLYISKNEKLGNEYIIEEKNNFSENSSDFTKFKDEIPVVVAGKDIGTIEKIVENLEKSEEKLKLTGGQFIIEKLDDEYLMLEIEDGKVKVKKVREPEFDYEKINVKDDAGFDIIAEEMKSETKKKGTAATDLEKINGKDFGVLDFAEESKKAALLKKKIDENKKSPEFEKIDGLEVRINSENKNVKGKTLSQKLSEGDFDDLKLKIEDGQLKIFSEKFDDELKDGIKIEKGRMKISGEKITDEVELIIK